MEIYLAEKLRALRAETGISQEKLAEYLNVWRAASQKMRQTGKEMRHPSGII